MRDWARYLISTVLIICAWLIFFEEYRPAVVVALCGLSILVSTRPAWKVTA